MARNFSSYISWGIRFILVAFSLAQFVRDPRGLLWMLPLTLASFIPALLPNFPPLHQMAFTAVFGIGTLGVFYQAYARIPLLDDVMHLLTPAVLALLFFHIFSVYLKIKRPKHHAFLSVMAIALLWELFEWIIATYLAPAIPFRISVQDTFLDLTLAVIAASLVLTKLTKANTLSN